MSFSRTPSGLTNMAMFYSADFIVFTEGGVDSFSTQDALDGNYNTSSVDIKFWSTVFKKYGFERKVHFRALGSKNSAEELAQKVARNEISNALVVRDSDLDHYFDRKIDSPFVLYTYGYSWENDAWHKSSILFQLDIYNMGMHIPEQCIDAISKSLSTLNIYARRLLLVELIHRQNGIKFVTSCTGEQFINGRNQPQLKSNDLLKLIRQNKKRIKRPAKCHVEFDLQEALRYCYGKLYECLAYKSLAYVCKTYLGIKSLPKDLIIPQMISNFTSLKDPEIDRHYQEMIDKLNYHL